MSTFIISEAGVSMNGDLDTALRMVDVAKEAGCNAWKGQCFWGFPKFQHLELSRDEFTRIKEHCDNIGIEFMATPDTIEAVDFLAELGMKRWKIGSRNIVNRQFLKHIREVVYRSPMYISTGMCTLLEVTAALYEVGVAPWRLGGDFTLLQCTSCYPAEAKNVGLRAMVMMGKRFEIPFGLSDHSLGIHIPIAAVAMGASVIEKHFTLDKTQEGADHHMSLEPYELSQMVKCIRDVEAAMGDGVKKPTEYELKVRNRLRNYKDCK